jgi:hypothetical protein
MLFKGFAQATEKKKTGEAAVDPIASVDVSGMCHDEALENLE